MNKEDLELMQAIVMSQNLRCCGNCLNKDYRFSTDTTLRCKLTMEELVSGACCNAWIFDGKTSKERKG